MDESRGVTPFYLDYIDMCGFKEYGFTAVFVRNSVSILAILVSNTVMTFALESWIRYAFYQLLFLHYQ